MGHQICLIHILRRRATEGYTSSRGSPITRTAGIPRAIYEGLWERLTKNEKPALQQIFFIFLKNILGLQANYPPSTQIGRPTTFVLSNIQRCLNRTVDNDTKIYYRPLPVIGDFHSLPADRKAATRIEAQAFNRWRKKSCLHKKNRTRWIGGSF